MRGALLDELLRWIPHRTSVGLARIALEDVDVHGVRISAVDPVYVSCLAANRDPDVFPDPDRTDPGRDPDPHLSFGNGHHYCTGAVLARMQTELLVDTLLERLPGLRLAVRAEQVEWRRRTMIRGPCPAPGGTGGFRRAATPSRPRPHRSAAAARTGRRAGPRP